MRCCALDEVMSCNLPVMLPWQASVALEKVQELQTALIEERQYHRLHKTRAERLEDTNVMH